MFLTGAVVWVSKVGSQNSEPEVELVPFRIKQSCYSGSIELSALKTRGSAGISRNMLGKALKLTKSAF